MSNPLKRYQVLKLFHSRHQVLYQPSSGENLRLAGKMASKGAVPKNRMLSYTFEDFQRLAAATEPRMAAQLKSLRSKEYRMYLITYSRREATIFSRKRFLWPSGASTPFHFYKNDRDDENEIL